MGVVSNDYVRTEALHTDMYVPQRRCGWFPHTAAQVVEFLFQLSSHLSTVAVNKKLTYRNSILRCNYVTVWYTV